jgi:hypothetical protein
MDRYELRAELQYPARLGGSHTWHVVLQGGGEALCGRKLTGDGTSEVLPISDAALVIQPCRCRACFRLYERGLTACRS